MERFYRKEFKYFVPSDQWDYLRERILAHMTHDPFCANLEQTRYTVRSIYFDTPNLLFYYEKVDGQKLRKKLRVRVYNELTEDAPAFLEIKRRIDDTIVKDRASVPFKETLKLTNGAQLNLLREGEAAYGDKVVRDRFVYLVKRLQLEPKVLITYEREAFFDPENPDLRVTFDYNVRSYYSPALEDIFRENDLRTFTDPCFILEVKFSLAIPLWLRMVLRDFRLHLQSISKYCNGLDRWYDQESHVEASA